MNWRKYVKFAGPYDFYWVNPPGQMQKLSYVDINQSPYNRILCGVRALQGTGIAPNDRAHGIFGFDYIQHKANIFGVVPTTWDDGSAIGASIPSGEPDVLVIVNDSQWYCLEIEVSITSATVNRVRIYVDGVRILSRQNANMTQFMNAGSKGGVYQDAVSWGGSTGDGPLRDIHIFTDNYIVAREYIGPNGVAGQGPASPSGLNLS